MKYTLGAGEVRAQMMFVNIDPNDITRGSVEKLLSYIFYIAQPQIEEAFITTYVMYVEVLKQSTVQFKDTTNPISGRIEPRTLDALQKVLALKMKHIADAYRKQGNVSTHPKKFLTPTTLIVIAGSQDFLMDAADLMLEREGILRDDLIRLLKNVARLKPFSGGTRHNPPENFVHLLMAHDDFYSGNIEALGIRASNVFTEEQLMERLVAAP